MLQSSQHGRNRRGGRVSSISFAAIVAALLICIPVALGYARAGAALRRVTLDDLRLTNGAVVVTPDGELAIDTPSSRGVVRNVPTSSVDQAAEIRFRYLGPSKADKPLASGELRRQIGLKLRAAELLQCDLCHVAHRARRQDRGVGQAQRDAQPRAVWRPRL